MYKHNSKGISLAALRHVNLKLVIVRFKWVILLKYPLSSYYYYWHRLAPILKLNEKTKKMVFGIFYPPLKMLGKVLKYGLLFLK